MVSVLNEIGLLVAMLLSCQGILVMKLSEEATGKMISRRLESMDFKLFNLTGKPIIRTDYVRVENITAAQLEGVAVAVKFTADAKMTMTIDVKRMNCTVDVDGNLMGFVKVNDKPLVEFFDSVVTINIAVGASGEDSVSMVTFCSMKVNRAAVTSQHWAVNVAKIKVVPLLTSGTHLSDKLCPHIKEKLLGNILSLLGLAGPKSVWMNEINMTYHVLDRGIVHSFLYVAYQESQLKLKKSEWGRDLLLQAVSGATDVEFVLDVDVVNDVIKSSARQSYSKNEKAIDKKLTLHYLEKYFKMPSSFLLSGYETNWTCNMEMQPIEIVQGKIILPVETTLSLNIKHSACTILKVDIDNELTLFPVSRATDVLFYIQKWSDTVKTVSSAINKITDIKGFLSEFKLYRWLLTSEDVFVMLRFSSLFPRKLSLCNTTLTTTQEYLVIQSNIEFSKVTNRKAASDDDMYLQHDIITSDVTHRTMQPESCTVRYSNDRTVVIEFTEAGNTTSEHTNSGRQTSPDTKLFIFILLCLFSFCTVV